jgi:uncharacterized LabA/DUF88 family protein
MIVEPASKRVVAFVDGQNLFHSAKQAFGHRSPSYRFPALAHAVCGMQPDWTLTETRFYTGVPVPNRGRVAKRWYDFWSAKLLTMKNDGVKVFQKPLRYRDKPVQLGDGSLITAAVGEEKGVDVRIALDIVRRAFQRDYDVALVFSRDQDLAEVCRDIRVIAREQQRWIKIASAYPWSDRCRDHHGIRDSDWIRIDQATYDRCIDPDPRAAAPVV